MGIEPLSRILEDPDQAANRDPEQRKRHNADHPGPDLRFGKQGSDLQDRRHRSAGRRREGVRQELRVERDNRDGGWNEHERNLGGNYVVFDNYVSSGPHVFEKALAAPARDLRGDRNGDLVRRGVAEGVGRAELDGVGAGREGDRGGHAGGDFAARGLVDPRVRRDRAGEIAGGAGVEGDASGRRALIGARVGDEVAEEVGDGQRDGDGGEPDLGDGFAAVEARPGKRGGDAVEVRAPRPRVVVKRRRARRRG